MWKKILVAMIALVGTISVVSALENKIEASGSASICSNITGRISTDTNGLMAGDLIKLSTGNFRIIGQYGNLTTNAGPFLALTNKSLATAPYGGNSSTTPPVSDQLYSTSNVRTTITGLTPSENDLNILSKHTKILVDPGANPMVPGTADYEWNNSIPASEMEYFFPLGVYNGDVAWASNPALAFESDYWYGFSAWTNNYFSQVYISASGTPTKNGDAKGAGVNTPKAIRAASIIDDSKIVFSMDVSCNQAGAKIKEPEYNVGSPMTSAKGNAMLVRYLDNTRSVNFDKITRNEIDNKAITKIAKGNDVYLHYIGASPSDGNTSLLVKDATGKFYYYQSLGGGEKGTAEVFTSTWEKGVYTLYLVNETGVSGDDPIASSGLVRIGDFTISDGLEIAYTAQYDTGSTILNTYEVSKNVNAGNSIGEISYEAGVDPISYELVADDVNSEDYKNFELSVTTVSNSAKANVKVKNDLTAGTHSFCIIAKDANGDPKDEKGDPSLKKCINLEVEKTKPELSFTNLNQTQIQIGGSDIGETIKTNNGEITLPNDSKKYQPKYELEGGVSGTGLTISNSTTDPKGFTISIGSTSSATLPATFKLKATLPATDNYTSISAEKEIFVYRKMGTLEWKPTKTGQYAIEDVAIGKTVGTLLVSDGVANFTYSLTSADDEGYDATKGEHNNLFKIDEAGLGVGAKAEVKTKSDLSAGTYKIQFKVIDNNGDISYADATIVVSAASQPELIFKEDGKTITTKTIYYDDTGQALNAEGGLASLTNSPTYALSDTQLGGLDASQYLEVSKSGILTPKKITEAGKPIKVTASKKGNDVYADVSAEIEIIIQPAKQSITFVNTDNPRKIKQEDSDVEEIAHGVLESNGEKDSGVGGITYSSANTNLLEIDETTGKITPKGTGTVEITATLNKKDTADYNENYETKSITKSIYVYEAMELTFTSVNPNLKAESSAKATTKAGTVTATKNAGQVTYSIQSDTSLSGNKDGDAFTIDETTGFVRLKNAITANDLHIHGNPYKVQVIAKDNNGTASIDIEITIDLADNDFYFVDPDKTTEKITKLNEFFALNKTIQLVTRSSNGGSVTYKLKDKEAVDVIEISLSGEVAIKKKGGPIYIEATVTEGSGYAGKTIELPITITAGEYTSIAFDNPDTTYMAYTESVSVEEPATLIPDGKIKYEVEEESKVICTIDTNGTVSALSAGTCKIKASSADTNYTEISTTKEVIFYEGATGSFKQTNIPQANEAPASTTIGIAKVEGAGVGSKYTYTIHTETNSKNLDKDIFKVDEDYGTVALQVDVGADVLKKKTYNEQKGGYLFYVQVDAKDAKTGDAVIIDCEIIIKGAKLENVYFADDDGNATTKIIKTYQKDGTFSVSLLNNAGGIPEYSIKSGPQDVIDPTIEGNLLSIRNANDEDVLIPVILQAKIPAANGYEETYVTCEVEVIRADQPDFKFKDTKIQMMPNSSVDPEFMGVLTEKIPIVKKSDDKSIVTVNDTTIFSKDKEGVTTITAWVDGNRNYKDAYTTIQVEVTNTPAYPFVIDIDDVTYGDDDHSLKAKVTTDGHTNGAIIARTWTSSDLKVATVDEKTGKVTIVGAGSTTISCTQTSSIDPDVKSSVIFNVLPKPIEIIIDDKEKYVGEEVPAFTVQISEDELVEKDIIDEPTYSCVDGNGKTVDAISSIGEYEIKGSYPKDAYPNYAITIVEGILTVKQDVSSEPWYSLIGKDTKEGKASNTWAKEDIKVTLEKTESDPYDEISINDSDWDNDYILVEKEGRTSTDVYFRKSDTKALATTQNTTLLIDKTSPEIIGITGDAVEQDEISKLLNTLTFGKYFKPKDEISIEAKDIQKQGVDEISGLKEVHYEIYELDKKTGLPLTDTPYDEDTIKMDSNSIKFQIDAIGLYRICAVTEDVAGNTSTKKCADMNIKKINVDEDGDNDPDYKDSNDDGCPDLNIILGTDTKGNPVKLNVAEKGKKYPYMNIDSNGDGKPDLNIDTDHDGRPDLNLVIMNASLWKPKVCVLVEKLKDYTQPIEYCTGTNAKAIINVDTDRDGVPDLNIDTDGDMKADINISDDGKIANRNLVNLHEWVPETSYTKDGFPYDTMSIRPKTNIDTDGDGLPDVNIDFDGDGIPDINIDIDDDWIPDTNIDTTGDGKPDVNIDTAGDGIPKENIIVIKEWIPKKNVNGKIPYDTMELTGEPTVEDGGIIIEKPDGGKFLPNTAIKVHDISDTIDETTKETINDIAGEQIIKKVYEVNYLVNGEPSQPEEKINVKIPVDTTIKNPKVIIEKEDGTYEVVEVKEEGGYYVFQTEYVGKVSVIGDPEEVKVDDPQGDPAEPDVEKPDTPKQPTSVQGTYTKGDQASTSGIGGAYTGDETNQFLCIGGLIISALLCLTAGKKVKG